MPHPGQARRLSGIAGLLERGVTSFTQMRGATELLATIYARETALMQAIFSGDLAPFPPPLD